MFSFMLSLSVGLGVMDEEFGKQREAPIGIVELSQPINDRFSIDYFHASSIVTRDIDYGVNILFIKMRLK